VLDGHLEPVPVGVTGELYIGGAGLARGYLRRPELTAERFVGNPFGSGRLYRTGDWARWLSDGRLVCLGRTDHQVKLRGFRIELGEIESVLRQVPGVSEAVVVAREDVPGDKRLVAYVVPEEGSETGQWGSLLRDHLRAQVPEYMVPSAFVELEAMPLTSNEKVDRKALPVPVQGRPGLEQSYIAPKGTFEVKLTRIWEDVLGVRPIGVNENFFDLGGHSFLALNIIDQVEKQFGKRIPVRIVFHAPTVERFTRLLRRESGIEQNRWRKRVIALWSLARKCLLSDQKNRTE